MSDTESFEHALSHAQPLCMISQKCNHEIADCPACHKSMVDRLRRAHDREIRDTAQREYHRGYEAGRHSMDAEHRAIAMRLRALPLDGGSDENLSSIAYAIYPCATGWTCESAEGLRDKLIELMGGVSDGPADDSDGNADCGYRGRDIHFDGVRTYDVLGNERQKAVCELRYIRDCLKGDFTCNSLNIANAIGAKLDVGDRLHESICNRLIHLLGGDQPSGIDVMNSYELRIEKLRRQRDELRAEREELKRAAKEHADLFENMARDFNETEQERDELRRKVDELESFDPETSIAAFSDDNDELRRLLSRAATLLANAEQDRDANYAYWMDCKEKVVHANVTIDELQAKLDKANGENKGLRLSVDEQKESIAQRKKTIKKLTRDCEKMEKQRDELQAKLDAIRGVLHAKP